MIRRGIARGIGSLFNKSRGRASSDLTGKLSDLKFDFDKAVLSLIEIT